MIYEIPTQAQTVPGLEDYLKAVRERWRVILLVMLVFFAGAVYFSGSRVPTYQAEARVVINPTPANAFNNNLVLPALEREVEVIASNAVAERASELLNDVTPGSFLRALDVNFVNKSDTLSLSYTSTDSAEAARRVNAMADAYVQLREEASANVTTSQLELMTAELSDLESRNADLDVEIAAGTSRRLDAYALDPTAPTRPALIAEADDELRALRAEQTLLNTNIDRVTREMRGVERTAASRGSTAEVIQYADPPSSPSGPSTTLLATAGLMAGTIAGVALAFVLDRLDRTAKDSADVEAAIGTSVLGSIPKYGFTTRRRGLAMLSSSKTNNAQRTREAYRRVRATLLFLQTSRSIKAIVVTSAHAGEGKSSTVANLGVAAAHAGSNVVIVSADMRRPTQEKLLGAGQDTGLSDYLAEPSTTNILVPIPGVPGLVVLPSGPIPSNPGELLGSDNFAELVADLRNQFDLVLIDMPPVLSAADAGAAAFHADGVVIVVDGERTDTDALVRVRANLEKSGGRIVGAILNKDRSETGLTLRRSHYAYEKAAKSA